MFSLLISLEYAYIRSSQAQVHYPQVSVISQVLTSTAQVSYHGLHYPWVSIPTGNYLSYLWVVLTRCYLYRAYKKLSNGIKRELNSLVAHIDAENTKLVAAIAEKKWNEIYRAGLCEGTIDDQNIQCSEPIQALRHVL